MIKFNLKTFYFDRRAASIIEEEFESMMIDEQDILGDEKAVEKFLCLVPDDMLRSKLKTEMLNVNTSADRWKVFEAMLNMKTKKVINHFSNNHSSKYILEYSTLKCLLIF